MRHRRNWVLAAGLGVALVALAPLAHAQPRITQAGGRTVVSNEHYVVTLSPTIGGFIESITTPDGAPLTFGHHIYTDRGLWKDSVYLGSRSEDGPAMQTTDKGNYVVVESSGSFRPEPGVADEPFPQITYTIRHRFDTSPTIHVSWVVTAQLDKPCDSGFLAYVLAIAPHREWFADTVGGRMFRAAAESDGRTFQSVSDPLSLEEPWLGVLLDSGMLLHFSGLESNVPFANVFFHQGADRSTALFFARLDGPHRAPVETGVSWEAGFSLTIVPSLQEWRP